MKNLITAIKSQLQTDLNYVREGDIFITPDERYIPKWVKFPAVGIKDGAITRTELAGGMWEVVLTVTLIALAQLQKEEASIMGDGVGQKGVIEMAEDIHASLDTNLLGISEMQLAFSPSEGPSEMLLDENLMLQGKSITYQYVKEELRAAEA